MGNIVQRKERLEAAREELKKEFVGIDDPIDEIVELAHSWYCFPEGQIRPTVINLVGMTGVGKTSLIERLFKLLELENVYYKFDMGYYASNTENLKHELSKKVRSFDGDPICFVMDEFQLCRSIDGDGEEIDRSNFRPIWDLLDSGKLNLVEPSYGLETLHLLKTKLEHCIENGLTSKGLTITKGEKFFVDLLGNSAFDNEGEFSTDVKEVAKKPSMVPSEYFYYIQQCVPNRFMGDGELRNYLDSLRDEDSIVDFLSETIELGGRPKTYDFSSSIIFVIANIDEAYTASKEVDPDMDADGLHKHSLDIGIFDVKQCLGKRFRSEQIARLGNNYVIYPSFSSDTYRKLVELELKKKQEVVKSKFNIDIEFDRSLKKIIYNEGVFPTQGTRPVFTTINYIVGSFIGRMLGHLEEKGIMDRIARAEWSFKKGRNHIVFFEQDSNVPVDSVSYSVKIKVDSLRRAKHNDEQALTSVHEAGHAVVSVALLGQVPTKVMSSSAGGAEGLNIINWSKMKSRDYLLNMASVCIAGIEAEKIVFGENNCGIDGAHSDMETATELITNAVQGSGVYQPFVSHSNPMRGSTNKMLDDQHKTTHRIEAILNDAKARAINTLNKNRAALNALSLELFKHPVLDKKRVAEVLLENGMDVKEKEVGFYRDHLLALAPTIKKIA